MTPKPRPLTANVFSLLVCFVCFSDLFDQLWACVFGSLVFALYDAFIAAFLHPCPGCQHPAPDAGSWWPCGLNGILHAAEIPDMWLKNTQHTHNTHTHKCIDTDTQFLWLLIYLVVALLAGFSTWLDRSCIRGSPLAIADIFHTFFPVLANPLLWRVLAKRTCCDFAPKLTLMGEKLGLEWSLKRGIKLQFRFKIKSKIKLLKVPQRLPRA